MPEFHLLNLLLGVLVVIGFWWTPLLCFLPLLLLSAGAPLVYIIPTLAHTRFASRGLSVPKRWAMTAMTGLLHIIQPIARLHGRIAHGLAPWRRPRKAKFIFPRRWQNAQWTKHWIDPHERLTELEKALHAQGLRVWRGNTTEPWDLEACTGLLASTRMLMAVEDHGSGTQYVRFKCWPRFSRIACAVIAVGTGLSVIAGVSGAPPIAPLVTGTATFSLLSRMVREAAWSAGAAVRGFRESQQPSVKLTEPGSGVIAAPDPGTAES